VQAAARQPLSGRATRRWATAAVRLLEAAFPYDSVELEFWPVCALLLPHALAAAEHADRVQANPAATAWLLNQAGLYLWARGELTAAHDALERSLVMDEARLGPNHPSVAASVTNLGMVLSDLGSPKAARDAYQRALTINQARLGPDHPNTANSLNNLAMVLAALGESGQRTDGR
jgi:tetratricopeptide (TPR) repeat protein